MKILLIYSVAGGLGATIRNQLETIDADKYELLTIASTNPEHRVWQEKGYPVRYMTAEQFVLLRKSEEFYWIAKTEENQSFYGILKEDVMNAMKSQNKVSYLELSLSDCIEIKNDYPEDVYFLAINEWNSYEEQESEDTKILRKNADYFIDTFVDVQKVLETIRKDLI